MAKEVTRKQAIKAILVAQKYMNQAPRELTGAAIGSLNHAKIMLEQGSFDFAKRSAIISLGWTLSEKALVSVMPELSL